MKKCFGGLKKAITFAPAFEKEQRSGDMMKELRVNKTAGKTVV